MKRQIININQKLCNGCGACIPNCPEGAIQIIDGKARLVSDLFCDGLGACLGHCPEGAITTVTREAEAYNEKIVMANIVKQGVNTIKAHLEHLNHHGESELYNQAIEYLNENKIVVPNISKTDEPTCDCGSADVQEKFNNKLSNQVKIPKIVSGCPGSLSRMLNPISTSESILETSSQASQRSELRNWPIQINLLPLQAKYFNDSDVLLAADCVTASYPNFHREFVKDHTLMIGCPKLDDSTHYIEKLAKIFELNAIHSLHVVIMEVPCCSGLLRIAKMALEKAGKGPKIPLRITVVTTNGQIKQ
ncbi:hypothetical protein NEF87_000351 [Candidatus Lokiarchaeum ossiferum]|uniref:4Fe-4S ferredoxin-type domain-containing protein n=1 Tax=Candidatus Lokiarchaeum ossiferum TaxID=2951803 RepID=A0ABY6HKL0_9ARCH|nr:hypothetical protein NEF87_000351 [Candidatus Lokiarchaeum sp. B-35]